LKITILKNITLKIQFLTNTMNGINIDFKKSKNDIEILNNEINKLIK
jgi:hypothetical protein